MHIWVEYAIFIHTSKCRPDNRDLRLGGVGVDLSHLIHYKMLTLASLIMGIRGEISLKRSQAYNGVPYGGTIWV